MGPASTLILVDGSNVTRHAAWLQATRHERAEVRPRRFVDIVASWAAAEGHSVVIVFDGAVPEGVHDAGDLVQVQAAPAPEGGADPVLEVRAREAADAGRSFWVVSGDHTVQQVAGAAAERVLDPEVFVRLLGAYRMGEAAKAARRSAHDERQTGAHGARPDTRIGDLMDAGLKEQLERIRRGLNPDTGKPNS